MWMQSTLRLSMLTSSNSIPWRLEIHSLKRFNWALVSKNIGQRNIIKIIWSLLRWTTRTGIDLIWKAPVNGLLAKILPLWYRTWSKLFNEESARLKTKNLSLSPKRTLSVNENSSIRANYSLYEVFRYHEVFRRLLTHSLIYLKFLR